MTTLLWGASSIYGVGDEATLARRHADFVRRNQGGDPVDLADGLVAIVSEHRWVADCPQCGAGIGLHPGWAGRCFGCGGVYASVTFPADRDRLEQCLVGRTRNRNWHPGQTLSDLEHENRLLGMTMSEER